MELNTEGIPTHRFDMKRPSGADSNGRSNFIQSNKVDNGDASYRTGGSYSNIPETIPKSQSKENTNRQSVDEHSSAIRTDSNAIKEEVEGTPERSIPYEK